MNDSQKLAIGGGLVAAIVGGVLWSRGGTILGPVGMVTTIAGTIIAVGGAVSAFNPQRSRRMRASESNPKKLCRSSSEVQSLVFPRDEYTVEQAKAWARKHGFTARKAHVKANTIRIRQTSPKGYRRMRTKTLDSSTGVKAVVGWKHC